MKLALKILLSRKALLGALPVVVALLLSGVISFSYNLLLKNYRDAVDHTFQVMSGIDNVLLQEGNAQALPFVDDSFDLVSAIEVFEHLERPERALAGADDHP